MKKYLLGGSFIMLLATTLSQAQVSNDADGLFDSTSYVETDSTTNTTSNVTTNNTNTNDTTINSTNTNNNTNTSTITSTNTNNNNNVNTTTSTNTNTNTNNTTIDQTTNSTSAITSTNTNNNNTNITQTTTSTIDQTIDQNITSNVTSNNTNTNTNTNTNNTTINSTAANTNNNNNNNTSDINQKIESPPPSAIAPTIMGGGNDTCTVTYSAAVQTQILGASGGGHIRDLNCERLKNSKALYNMGMKVAAVALMCQDPGVFEAMRMAGTPCPFMGEIGDTATNLWNDNPNLMPDGVKVVELAGESNEATKDISSRSPLRIRR